MPKIHLAIDGNEANIPNRVGSNVYAFHIIQELSRIIKHEQDVEATILLANKPIADLPPATDCWRYRTITPRKFWTQLAAPWHLYTHQYDYNVFYTPGHYAPRFCAIPYVSSVMDLAFLTFPDHFAKNDLLQLQKWTAYSVKNARKVVAISQFTKQEIIKHYHLPEDDVVVAHPSVSVPTQPASKAELIKFLLKHKIRQPFFLYLGTLQPRKNLINLIKAYEIFCKEVAQKRKDCGKFPQLVLGGKVGWLTEPILEAIERSPVKSSIILTGYIPQEYKPELYRSATATVLVGLYEGFGIPALESMQYSVLPIVSNSSSLPEVVGESGLLVNPHKPDSIAAALKNACQMPEKEKKLLQSKMQTQRSKFSWRQSAETVFQVLLEVAQENPRDEKLK